jgi:isocitrate dehydrogenase (NAD+)
MYRAAVVSGDGIGPEITQATLRVLEATGLGFEWIEAPLGMAARRSLGSELPFESLETIRRLGVALKAPLVAERQSGGVAVRAPDGERRYPSVNNALRRELGAYVNLRPIRGWPISGRYADLDVVIAREITEDTYVGVERWADPETAEAVKRISRGASLRVARFAFEWARRHGRRKVTAVHKANVLHMTDGLFLECARQAARDYPEIEFDDRMVDAACYLLVKEPRLFDVVLAPNQYGDILSDLAAGLIGSLGLAPGANIGPGTAIFEASHGAAPDIAGKGVANPAGLILSGAMLLDHLGESAAAERLRRAIEAVLAAGRDLTPDLGGSATTEQFTSAVCRELASG